MTTRFAGALVASALLLVSCAGASDTATEPDPTAAPTATEVQAAAPDPTPEPVVEPTAEPTEQPTPEPTEEPTAEPTEEPTPEPTEEPTPKPQDGDDENSESEPPAGDGSTTAIDGAAIYAVNCAGCHGADGAGSDRGPALIGIGQFFTEDAAPVVGLVTNGGTKMPEFGSKLSPEEIAVVVEYVVDTYQ